MNDVQLLSAMPNSAQTKANDMSDRTYDLVLFGATGFTGGLTAEYLAANAPDGLRWALAGRNTSKLESVRERLAAIDPRLSELPLVRADIGDQSSIDELAASTNLVVTTVGPYALYGEGLVAACAKAGTDYADLTGEPEFVDDMWLKYNDEAVASGARIVHTCGFDSVPHDLGAYFTVKQLPEGVPVTVKGYVKTGARFSGGTFYSAITGFSRARQTLKAGKERRKKEPKPTGRKVKSKVDRIHKELWAGGWVAPLPTIDGFVILRSAAAVDRYGPDFKYGHYLAARRLPTIIGMGVGVSTAFVAAQIPPVRKLMLKYIEPGEGPSEERRAKSWFRVRFEGEGGGKTVRTEISGGDPGYTETSKMLAECGLALVETRGTGTGGQQTPVTAIGEQLLERLPAAGIELRVID